MKILKVFKAIVESRLIFFTAALVCNLILGFYLKDFRILSPTLLVFYLLSVLPTLFLLADIKSKAMRTVVYTVHLLVICMNVAYAIYCLRFLPFMIIISLWIEILYFIVLASLVKMYM